MTRIERHKSAMHRTDLSRPLRLAIADSVLRPDETVFDYGCGRGGDIARLRARGWQCDGWDPVHRPDGPRLAASVVNLGYVLNVIEDPEERVATLQDAWAMSQRVLVASVRLVDEKPEDGVAPFGDGIVTRRATFQKFYHQSEFAAWLRQTLDADPVVAGPGVFYLFRIPGDAATFAASRFRSRPALGPRSAGGALLAAHRQLADELIAILETRGREPIEGEVPDPERFVAAFGSLRRGSRLALTEIGAERWSAIRAGRRDDLLVFLALGKFEGRRAFGDLPDDLQADVRALFGSHRTAEREAADALLGLGRTNAIEEAIAVAHCGKTLPTAFYVHSSAVDGLPVALRLYEGCARALIGRIEGSNLIKFARKERKVSYLSYPRFEADAHPALAESTRVDLQTFDVKTRRFDARSNPPVLHRKETFLPMVHPARAKYARLTASEEAAGLYREPHLIGTAKGWQDALDLAGRMVVGHRLTRRDRV